MSGCIIPPYDFISGCQKHSLARGATDTPGGDTSQRTGEVRLKFSHKVSLLNMAGGTVQSHAHFHYNIIVLRMNLLNL